MFNKIISFLLLFWSYEKQLLWSLHLNDHNLAPHSIILGARQSHFCIFIASSVIICSLGVRVNKSWVKLTTNRKVTNQQKTRFSSKNTNAATIRTILFKTQNLLRCLCRFWIEWHREIGERCGTLGWACLWHQRRVCWILPDKTTAS